MKNEERESDIDLGVLKFNSENSVWSYYKRRRRLHYKVNFIECEYPQIKVPKKKIFFLLKNEIFQPCMLSRDPRTWRITKFQLK